MRLEIVFALVLALALSAILASRTRTPSEEPKGAQENLVISHAEADRPAAPQRPTRESLFETGSLGVPE